MAAGGSRTNDPRVLMGRIGAAQGLRGDVRIQSHAADPLAIADYGPLTTDRAGLTLTITKLRPHKGIVVASLAGITDRTAAEKLNGVSLYVSRDQLPDADVNEYYHADLIGLTALDATGTLLGKVTALPNYGAGDLIEIARPGGEALLLPFTGAVVPTIDLEAGTLTVVPPVEVGDDPEDEA